MIYFASNEDNHTLNQKDFRCGIVTGSLIWKRTDLLSGFLESDNKFRSLTKNTFCRDLSSL